MSCWLHLHPWSMSAKLSIEMLARSSIFLSQNTSCSHCKKAISVYQIKVFDERYHELPLPCCAPNVRKSHHFSHTNFNWTKLNNKAKMVCLYSTDLYDRFTWRPFDGANSTARPFPIVTWNPSKEWALCLTKVNLPEIDIARIKSAKNGQLQ